MWGKESIRWQGGLGRGEDGLICVAACCCVYSAAIEEEASSKKEIDGGRRELHGEVMENDQ